MRKTSQGGASSFPPLHPETILNLAEKMLAREFSNLFRPLNSYINRVFELEDSSGAGVVVKFYRPGRWSVEAIAEEHRFLLELDQREIPVIAPLPLSDGTTLGRWRHTSCAFFPKCGGRSIDEFSDEQWLELGRLVGRVHAVGGIAGAPARPKMHPEVTTTEQIAYLLDNNLIHRELRSEFVEVCRRLLDEINPRFGAAGSQRIHGDLHFSNIIHRPGESFFLIDFDDMVVGPPVQDVWMLLGAYGEDSLVELDLFLEGYEMFHRFDRRSFLLIEPLRAMRYLHYLAWCGYQVVEDGATEVLPDYGSYSFWRQEIDELVDQIERIRAAENPYDQLRW